MTDSRTDYVNMLSHCLVQNRHQQWRFAAGICHHKSLYFFSCMHVRPYVMSTWTTAVFVTRWDRYNAIQTKSVSILVSYTATGKRTMMLCCVAAILTICYWDTKYCCGTGSTWLGELTASRLELYPLVEGISLSFRAHQQCYQDSRGWIQTVPESNDAVKCYRFGAQTMTLSLARYPLLTQQLCPRSMFTGTVQLSTRKRFVMQQKLFSS